MMVYLAELSTPLLHITWIMNTASISENALFVNLIQALLVSFFVCRVMLGPYMLTHLVRNYTGRTELYILHTVIVAGFNVLNFYWFILLTTLAMKKLKAASKKVPKVE